MYYNGITFEILLMIFQYLILIVAIGCICPIVLKKAVVFSVIDNVLRSESLQI